MKVKIHRLFAYLLESTNQKPDAIVGFSLSQSPTLGAFIDDLDPNLSLDWNQQSFHGLPALREHVLAQAGLDGICQPDDVLITAGASEANYLAMMQLVQPGDEIVIEAPGWPQAEVLAKAIGATIKRVHRREADGWALSIDQLEAAVNDRTKLIFLTNPNNPTGALLGASELEEIALIADQHGSWLLVDEVYAGLEWQHERAPSIAGLYRRGITAGSVSKALGLQGLRTGWMICQSPELIMDAVILRENSSEIMNIMGEMIAEIALRPDRLRQALAKARADGRKNLDHLNAFVASEPKLTWVPPQAGLIGLARLVDGMDSDSFAARLLETPYKTFILPGSAYDLSHHIRLGVGGGAETDLALGLERMSALLKAWDSV